MNVKKSSMSTPAPDKKTTMPNPNVAGKTGVILHTVGCHGNHLGKC